jgi:hypothetical protein
MNEFVFFDHINIESSDYGSCDVTQPHTFTALFLIAQGRNMNFMIYLLWNVPFDSLVYHNQYEISRQPPEFAGGIYRIRLKNRKFDRP